MENVHSFDYITFAGGCSIIFWSFSQQEQQTVEKGKVAAENKLTYQATFFLVINIFICIKPFT